jgi:hypothetical protein
MRFRWQIFQLVVCIQGHLRTASRRDDKRVAVYSYAFNNGKGGVSFYSQGEDVEDGEDVDNVAFRFDAKFVISQLRKAKFMSGASHFFYTNDNSIVRHMSEVSDRSLNMSEVNGTADKMDSLNGTADQMNLVNGTAQPTRWIIKLMEPDIVKEFCDHTTVQLGRVMTKYTKFKKLPNELLDFDYVVHKDVSYLSGPYFGTAMPTMNALLEEVQRSPQACLFALEHTDRKTVFEELKAVKMGGIENRTNAERWEAHLRDINFHDSWPLVQFGHFIRKVNCSKVEDAFSAVFDALISYDLNRDQIVIGVVAPGYLRLGEDVIIKPRRCAQCQRCAQWGQFCNATTTNISQTTFSDVQAHKYNALQ